jgi:hypothetical protein
MLRMICRCYLLTRAYPVIIPAHGRGGFQPGPATAEAEAAISERGQVVDTEEWTREVMLTVERQH